MAGKLKLLQVEDSESDAELILRELRRSGHDVESERVQDAEALRAALAKHGWDLIICDYRMPSFDAPAALEVLHSTGLDIPMLVISGNIGEDIAVAMMKAGASDYLMKDNLKRLGAAVERELREARGRAERRHTVRRLADREAQLSMAIEATDMGIFDNDPRTGKTFYSDLARKHLRVPAGAQPNFEVFIESLHPEDRQRVRSAVERAFQPDSDGRYAADYRLQTSEGEPDLEEERWISAWGRVLRDAQGAPIRFLGAIRDITEKKRAERELQFQLNLTSCITEQSTDCIMLVEPDGVTRFVNPETERVFGYSSDEIRAKPVHDLLHPRHAGGQLCPSGECPLTRDLNSTGIVRDREDIFLHKDGTRIDVSISCVPLVIDGARAGVVVTARDIRARKLAQQALRRSDARFRGLFDAGIIGIFVTEGPFVIEANDHMLKLLGYSREEISAQPFPWRKLVAPEMYEHCQLAMRSIGKTGSCAPYEKEYLRRDGTRVPVLFAGVELRPDGQVLCFVVDLTERKDLENQMRQAQKLESIGLLAGGVAHDFNNLLTVILGYADLLRMEIGSGHPLHGAVEQIADAADRAASLTRQLLTFSRRNAGQPCSIALDRLVAGVETMLRRLIGEHIEVIVSSEGRKQSINADPGLIEQVILNLAVNARDAMPDGGELYIETMRLTVSKGFAAPSLSVEPGEYVSLAVTDTGTGMTPEVQARLFEPFFTTKEVGKGTGLGLSTVYGIVKQSGGSITVHSTPGIGTSFRVMFPAVEADEPAEFHAGPDGPLEGAETVLLVEDETGVRNYVREVLESHGYCALDAARGEDAIQLAERYRGRIDLLLTDVVLPGMKGSEVVERFLALRPDAAVLRMSGYPERFGAQLSKGAAHLQKPFTAEKLLRRIRELLDAPKSR